MKDLAFLRSAEMMLIGLCIAGVTGLAVASGGNSLSANSTRSLLQFLAVPVLIGLAQMVVLAVGELNLAVGAMGGVSAVLTASLMSEHGWPTPLAMVACVLIGGICGVVNGVLIVMTKISGFIVTLATFTILTGLQYRIVGTTVITDYSPNLKSFGEGTVLGRIPWIFVVAIVVALLLSLFMRRAKAGRQMLATGGNAVAAELSGVSNNRSLVLAHTVSGLIVGVAALLTVASAPGINKSIGADWLLPSFAAPIIGGAVLTGGSVVVLGTVLAALIVRLVDAFRAEFQWEPTSVQFVIGAVVLGTVVVSQLRERWKHPSKLPTEDHPSPVAAEGMQ